MLAHLRNKRGAVVMSLVFNQSALAKGWKRYYIMHKNRRVASIREDGTCTLYYKSFLPFNLWLEQGTDFETRINNLNNFYYWCASRVLTLDRQYAKEIMNTIGAKQAQTDRDRALIAISYRALSLTDVYWIATENEAVNFEDISLFRHSLSTAFADISLCGKQITAQNAELLANRDAAGDIATNGVAPKAWIRKEGAFYLLKDGDERDVEAELLASKIADCFRVEHVTYSADYFENRKVSKSRLMTSEERSIVSMEFMDVYCANRNKDTQEFVLEKDAYSFYMMNIIDYLTGNADRHWGNWGFFVDNATNKPLKLHPLMDFNKAFTLYETLEGGKCQTVARNISQKQAAVEAVAKVGLNQTAEIQKKWFTDARQYAMFCARLNALKEVE